MQHTWTRKDVHHRLVEFTDGGVAHEHNCLALQSCTCFLPGHFTEPIVLDLQAPGEGTVLFGRCRLPVWQWEQSAPFLCGRGDG